MRAAGLIGLSALAALSLLAQDPSNNTGKRQFQQTCGFCHGMDGRGASGPDLIRSALVNRDVNENLIGPVIRNGRPAKGMPAFQWSDEQIAGVATFLHSEAQSASTVARRVPTEYPVEKLLVGNADSGKRYFNGAGTCATCHSTAGDLAHIATKYKPIDLQSRIAFPSGRNPSATIIDASGQTFTGDQVYSDEFLISLRDAAGWVRTWKRGSVKLVVRDPLAEHVALLRKYTDRDLHDLFAYLETFK